MKRLPSTMVILLALCILPGSTFAISFSLDVSNIEPSSGETVKLEIYINDMSGTDLWGMDFCITYDSGILKVVTMQVNDDSQGGCLASVMSITRDDGVGCVRLGGVKMFGGNCPFSGDYMLATMVLQTLRNEATTICAQLECKEPSCSYNFSGFVQDNIGKQGVGQISGACVSIMSSSSTTTPITSSSSSSTVPSLTTTTSIPSLDTTTTSSYLPSSTSSSTTTIKDTCVVTRIYGEDSPRTEQMRNFRDKIVRNTPEGLEVIKLYYHWSPLIVRVVEKDEECEEKMKIMIDAILSLIEKE